MDDPLAVVETLCRAAATGHVDDLLACYHDGADLRVFPEGPRWVTEGFAEVARGWRAFARSRIGLSAMDWIDGPHVRPGPELACVHGVLRMRTARGTVRLRLTWVLARDRNGRWRVVHEHGSQPVPDPYGTGDWIDEEKHDRT